MNSRRHAEAGAGGSAVTHKGEYSFIVQFLIRFSFLFLMQQQHSSNVQNTYLQNITSHVRRKKCSLT